MAIVGHWSSLTQAQYLTQTVLLRGVIEETIEVGQLIGRLPVTAITGQSLTFNRESTLPSADFFDIHEDIPWSSDVAYATQTEVSLKRVLRQDIIDKFMSQTYGNVNNYEMLILKELAKGCARTIEDKLIYGDVDNVSSKEFDGIYAWVSSSQDIDGGETAGTLSDLRKLIDLVRPRPTFLLTSHEIGRRLDAVAQVGVADSDSTGTVAYSTYSIGGVSFGIDQFGQRVTYFDGIPIIRSDYMVAEEANSGSIGSGARAKHSTGTAQYSILAVRTGPLVDGGCTMLVGGDTSGNPQLYRIERFDKLETKDAGGIRMAAYLALAVGSTKAVGALMDITDSAFTP